MGIFQWLFGSKPSDESRQAARNRLKTALVVDRSSVAPGLSDTLRRDMVDVLAKYMDVDAGSLQVRLEPHGEGMRWTADVQVVSVHRQAHLPAQALVSQSESGRGKKRQKHRSKRSLRAARWRRSQEELPSLEEQTA